MNLPSWELQGPLGGTRPIAILWEALCRERSRAGALGGIREPPEGVRCESAQLVATVANGGH